MYLFFIGLSETDQVEGRRMLLGSELHEQVERPLTEEEVLVSMDGFRTFIRDVREELLVFSREDMEVYCSLKKYTIC